MSVCCITCTQGVIGIVIGDGDGGSEGIDGEGDGVIGIGAVVVGVTG